MDVGNDGDSVSQQHDCIALPLILFPGFTDVKGCKVPDEDTHGDAAARLVLSEMRESRKRKAGGEVAVEEILTLSD